MVSSSSVPNVRIFLPHIWCLCGPHIFIICRIKLTCRLSNCSDFNRFKQYYTDDSTRDIFNIQRIACIQHTACHRSVIHHSLALLQSRGVHVKKVKLKVNKVYQLATCLTSTGTPVPYGIIQCYLPPGRGDIPALIPAEAGTRISDPGKM